MAIKNANTSYIAFYNTIFKSNKKRRICARILEKREKKNPEGVKFSIYFLKRKIQLLLISIYRSHQLIRTTTEVYVSFFFPPKVNPDLKYEPIDWLNSQ